MITSIIISEGVKQIVFTPENDEEKAVLKMITVNDSIEVLSMHGSPYALGGSKTKPFAANIGSCGGGYLRMFTDEDSRILVLKPKDPCPAP